MVDKDLLSIQEARALVRAARAAQAEFSQLGQERIDAVRRGPGRGSRRAGS